MPRDNFKSSPFADWPVKPKYIVKHINSAESFRCVPFDTGEHLRLQVGVQVYKQSGNRIHLWLDRAGVEECLKDGTLKILWPINAQKGGGS